MALGKPKNKKTRKHDSLRSKVFEDWRKCSFCRDVWTLWRPTAFVGGGRGWGRRVRRMGSQDGRIRGENNHGDCKSPKRSDCSPFANGIFIGYNMWGYPIPKVSHGFTLKNGSLVFCRFRSWKPSLLRSIHWVFLLFGLLVLFKLWRRKTRANAQKKQWADFKFSNSGFYSLPCLGYFFNDTLCDLVEGLLGLECMCKKCRGFCTLGPSQYAFFYEGFPGFRKRLKLWGLLVLSFTNWECGWWNSMLSEWATPPENTSGFIIWLLPSEPLWKTFIFEGTHPPKQGPNSLQSKQGAPFWVLGIIWYVIYIQKYVDPGSNLRCVDMYFENTQKRRKKQLKKHTHSLEGLPLFFLEQISLSKKSFSYPPTLVFWNALDDSQAHLEGTFTLHGSGKPRRCGGFRMWSKSLRGSCAENVVLLQLACVKVAHRKLCLLSSPPAEPTRPTRGFVGAEKTWIFWRVPGSEMSCWLLGGWLVGEKSSTAYCQKLAKGGEAFLAALCAAYSWSASWESHDRWGQSQVLATVRRYR